MRCEVFYRQATDEYRVVNSGFSILAFLFGWLWFLIRGNVKDAVLFFVVYVIIYSATEWAPPLTKELSGGPVHRNFSLAILLDSLWGALVLATFCGLYGRRIVNARLEDYGFKWAGVLHGVDESDCLKLVKAGKPVIPLNRSLEDQIAASHACLFIGIAVIHIVLATL
jgi:hypothetical protein